MTDLEVASSAFDDDGLRPYSVPVRQRGTVRGLARMDESAFDALIGVLEESAAQLSRAVMVSALEDALAYPSEKAEELVTALLGIHSVRIGRRYSEEQTARVVASDPALRLNAEESSVLIARYVKILSIPALWTLASARRTYNQMERIFCTADFQSSILAVREAQDTADAVPNSSLIITGLSIRYHEGDETKTFHVSLDLRSIGVLAEALASAVSRTQILTTLANAAGLTVVNSGDHH